MCPCVIHFVGCSREHTALKKAYSLHGIRASLGSGTNVCKAPYYIISGEMHYILKAFNNDRTMKSNGFRPIVWSFMF